MCIPIRTRCLCSQSPTAFTINGVSEILNLGNNKLLVMERSFSTGRLPCTIKLFIADLNGATDVGSTALNNNTSFIPAKKHCC
ncbi:MAG: esterase-like activity of phytase family protein [Chitinophagaceae bacterium]|nr:esterase-like activity of phytase family protein [Chitinophagaceae bacterium]